MQHLANFRPEYRMKWSLIKPAEYGRSHKFIQSMYAHVYSFRHFVRNEPLVCTTSKYMMDLPNPVERELLLGIIRMLSEVCLPLCVCLSVCLCFICLLLQVQFVTSNLLEELQFISTYTTRYTQYCLLPWNSITYTNPTQYTYVRVHGTY